MTVVSGSSSDGQWTSAVIADITVSAAVSRLLVLSLLLRLAQCSGRGSVSRVNSVTYLTPESNCIALALGLLPLALLLLASGAVLIVRRGDDEDDQAPAPPQEALTRP